MTDRDILNICNVAARQYPLGAGKIFTKYYVMLLD